MAQVKRILEKKEVREAGKNPTRTLRKHPTRRRQFVSPNRVA